MNPVEYTLNLQRLLALVAGFSFVGFGCVILLFDPYQNNLYLWVLLGILLLFLTSIISLLGFWWFFSFQKKILTIVQVNQVVYQSLITSCIFLILLVLQQTDRFSLWIAFLVLLIYFLYLFWANYE